MARLCCIIAPIYLCTHYTSKITLKINFPRFLFVYVRIFLYLCSLKK